MEKVYKIIASISVLLLLIPLTVGIVTRYVFGTPLAFVEELTRYALVWLSFLGAGLAAKEKGHMRVEFIVDKFSGKVKWYTNLLINLISVTALIIGTYYGIKMMIYNHGKVSYVMRVSMSYIYLAIVVGFTIMVYYLAKTIYLTIKHASKENPGQTK